MLAETTEALTAAGGGGAVMGLVWICSKLIGRNRNGNVRLNEPGTAPICREHDTAIATSVERLNGLTLSVDRLHDKFDELLRELRK